MNGRLVLAVGLSLAVGGWIGCGGGGPAPVSGTITYKDKPVVNASVSFTPVEGSGPAATGLTDSAGHYNLGTLTTNDGAMPGKYRVGVIARGPERAPKPGEVNSGMPGEMMPGAPVIPTKFFAPDTSGLTFEVVAGRNTADFPLKD